MKHWLFLLFIGCLSALRVGAQGHVVTADKPFIVTRGLDTAIMGPLERSGAAAYQSAKEMEYLYWVNLMRRDPSGFHTRYIIPFLQQFPEAVSEESGSLATDMQKTGSLSFLYPQQGLYFASSLHAAFLARTGRLTHRGEGDKEFAKRMEEVGVKDCAGEVIFEGKDDMLVALIILLIDHRVPGLGHRKALLNPSFTRTGAASRPSTEGRTVLVQDFSCK